MLDSVLLDSHGLIPSVLRIWVINFDQRGRQFRDFHHVARFVSAQSCREDGIDKILILIFLHGKDAFAEVFKNLAVFKVENNFIGSSK